MWISYKNSKHCNLWHKWVKQWAKVHSRSTFFFHFILVWGSYSWYSACQAGVHVTELNPWAPRKYFFKVSNVASIQLQVLLALELWFYLYFMYHWLRNQARDWGLETQNYLGLGKCEFHPYHELCFLDFLIKFLSLASQVLLPVQALISFGTEREQVCDCPYGFSLS